MPPFEQKNLALATVRKAVCHPPNIGMAQRRRGQVDKTRRLWKNTRHPVEYCHAVQS
jgi:hypothetical protein